MISFSSCSQPYYHISSLASFFTLEHFVITLPLPVLISWKCHCDDIGALRGVQIMIWYSMQVHSNTNCNQLNLPCDRRFWPVSLLLLTEHVIFKWFMYTVLWCMVSAFKLAMWNICSLFNWRFRWCAFLPICQQCYSLSRRRSWFSPTSVFQSRFSEMSTYVTNCIIKLILNLTAQCTCWNLFVYLCGNGDICH